MPPVSCEAHVGYVLGQDGQILSERVRRRGEIEAKVAISTREAGDGTAVSAAPLGDGAVRKQDLSSRKELHDPQIRAFQRIKHRRQAKNGQSHLLPLESVCVPS